MFSTLDKVVLLYAFAQVISALLCLSWKGHPSILPPPHAALLNIVVQRFLGCVIGRTLYTLYTLTVATISLSLTTSLNGRYYHFLHAVEDKETMFNDLVAQNSSWLVAVHLDLSPCLLVPAPVSFPSVLLLGQLPLPSNSIKLQRSANICFPHLHGPASPSLGKSIRLNILSHKGSFSSKPLLLEVPTLRHCCP